MSWAGNWTDVIGGTSAEATIRSDGSVWIQGDWLGLSKLTGVDALKDIRPRFELIDDGKATGGL